MPLYKLGKMEDKRGQVRLVTSISIIAFGTLASLFLGLGIALNNPTLSWIGGILMAGVPFVLSIIARFLQ